jgi:DNA modification methylase
MAKIEKTWVSVSGGLEPIDFDGPRYIRFPLDLAELVIDTFSAPGDWVIDPFCAANPVMAGGSSWFSRLVDAARDE